MPSKEALVIYARSVAATFGKMKLEDRCSFLKDMYDRTLLERPVNWTHNAGRGTNLDALRAGRWLRKNGVPGGTSVAAEGTSWCGIFAAYCLRVIGLPAQWRLSTGIDAPRLCWKNARDTFTRTRSDRATSAWFRKISTTS